MALVKLCVGGYVNTDAVGAVEVDVDMDEATQTRVTTTRVLDGTGQNVLLEIQTSVSSVIPNPSPNAVMRDNFIHDEVIAAIRDRRDARDWVDPDDDLT